MEHFHEGHLTEDAAMDQHIDNSRLNEVVAEKIHLNESELEHLERCDECREVVRALVREKAALKG